MGRLTERNTRGRAFTIIRSFKSRCEIYEHPEEQATYINCEAIDKLAEYEDLEEQGLLLRLPCKVGAFVWYTYYRKEPEKVKVSMLQQEVDGSWKIRLTPQGGSVFDVTLENFNKYCFLTKAEAEEALQRFVEAWNGETSKGRG